MKKHQEGITMLVVLVLLAVMLMGGLAMARITETRTLASGNAAFREAASQASEVGLNTAYMAARGIPADNVDASIAPWYWSTMQPTSAEGIPNVDFDKAPELIVGNYRVRYVVERMCNTAVITDTVRQCLVKLDTGEVKGQREGDEPLDPLTATQFRVTVRVDGPKDTQTWTQLLITKG